MIDVDVLPIDIRNALGVIHATGDVFEIRALQVGRVKTVSGYFDDLDRAAEACQTLTEYRGANAVYVTLNACDPALLARAENKLVDWPQCTTTDKEIVSRQWLFLDLDPARPTGISATESERQQARVVAHDVEDSLRERGWPYPVHVDSGNGWYLLYRIDLPNDAATDALLKRFYAGLTALCGDFLGDIKIDGSVRNAARIARVGGTWNRKGDDTKDRPHRRAVLHPPDVEYPVDVVPHALIADVASLTPDTTPARQPERSVNSWRNTYRQPAPLDLAAWLAGRNVEYKTKAMNGAVAYRITCPFDPNHGASGESSVIQNDTGLVTYHCMHDSCRGRTWHDVRAALGDPRDDQSRHEVCNIDLADHAPRNGAARPDQVDDQVDDPEPELEYLRITSAELDSGVYDCRYLVHDILVDQQPCLLAGPHKSLKTCLAIDLGISLATGEPFLGQFAVPEPITVALMSGESGLGTLQETARRVARAAGWELRDVSRLIWTPDLPIFGSRRYMDALRRFLERDQVRVAMLDPAYLCCPLAADKGGNLFAIGELLRSVNDVCADVGTTFVIAHHMKRTGATFDPPELGDVAWSGWAEWARQWLLLNRRETYDPDSAGEHKLWLAAGGSAGHSGLWGLDVVEGRRSDPGGRRWDVAVRSAQDVRAEFKDARESERERDKTAKWEADLTKAAGCLDQHPAGVTKTQLRDWIPCSAERASKLAVELVKRKIAERCLVETKRGFSTHAFEGFRRRQDKGND